MIRKKSILLKIFLFLGYSFLYIPILLIVIYSFNGSLVINVWSKFSLQWYYELFANDILIRAAINSFKIASISATISCILGTIGAVYLSRLQKNHEINEANMLMKIIVAPLIMPDVVVGFSLLLLFIYIGKLLGIDWYRGMLTIIIAHVTLSISYVISVIYSRLLELDPYLEEAALDLGVPPTKVFFLVILPVIFPSILTGWLLAFVLSFDDVVISGFVSGPGATTLPHAIFSSIRFGISPQINALTTILVIALSICVLIAGLYTYRANNNTEK